MKQSAERMENLDAARGTPGAVCMAVTAGGLWVQEGRHGQARGGASVAGLAGNCTALGDGRRR